MLGNGSMLLRNSSSLGGATEIELDRAMCLFCLFPKLSKTMLGILRGREDCQV